MSDETSGSAIQHFAEFFDSRGWNYTRDDNRSVIHLGFTGENARWQCVGICGPKDEHLIFMSLLPCRVPASRRTQVAELFARINWGLTHGCFELDVDTGEPRFRTSLPLPASGQPLEQVADLVFSNLWAVDNFFGTIMQVVYTKTAARNALAALAAASKPSPHPPSAPQRRFDLN